MLSDFTSSDAVDGFLRGGPQSARGGRAAAAGAPGLAAAAEKFAAAFLKVGPEGSCPY